MLLAQDVLNLNPSTGFENLNNITFQSFLSIAISFVLIVTAVILFFVIIGGGLTVILSGGNPQNQQKGQSAITAGIIGLLVVFGAWAIMTLLQAFFGINLLSFNIP